MRIGDLRALIGAVMMGTRMLASRRLPPPGQISAQKRLGALPADAAPVSRPVIIHWNEHLVPWIEAASDRDCAVALGVVHAHLRLGQMEILRRVAQGRLSEMAGPAALELDRALRIIGIVHAVPAIEAGLPPETREWIEGFVAGINHVLRRSVELPPEFALLGLEPEPWTVSDVLSVARIAGADVNWLVVFRLLQIRGREGWSSLWPRLLGEVAPPVPSLAGFGALGELLSWAPAGSNALAVAKARTAAGAAMLAGDPHLSVQLPNLWLIAGYRCPSYHVVGFMIPGLPMMALGRNPRIAWGGTNLHAAASDLFDVGRLPASEITERVERIRVRWWRDQRVRIRQTPYGPIVSDARALNLPRQLTVALRWIGHQPSDEISALLAVNRAESWDEFRDATARIAVPGQNLVYADADGRVGRALAAWLPRRPQGRPRDLVEPPSSIVHWRRLLTGRDLSAEIDPAEGFIASANERPPQTTSPVGYFFSPSDRVRRMNTLLAANSRVTVIDLSAIQRDVHVASALVFRDALIGWIRQLPPQRGQAIKRKRLVATLEAWDGNYTVDSVGAAHFELLLHHLVEAFYPRDEHAAYAAVWTWRGLIRNDLMRAPPERRAAALARAVDRAGARLDRIGGWGSIHRLKLVHVLGTAPLVGSRFRFGELGVGGTTDSLMKTAHDLAGGRHAVKYGSNARQICDFSDLDRNFFVLLGGQDAWFGSAAFLDQVPLWQAGRMIAVPLRPETVRASFEHRLELRPG